MNIDKKTPKVKLPNLEENKVAELKVIVRRFFTFLEKGEYEESRSLLANDIKTKASNDVLISIVAAVGTIDEFELSVKSIQLGIDGDMNVVLIYSRNIDIEKNIINKIRVIFNSNNKIVSIN